MVGQTLAGPLDWLRSGARLGGWFAQTTLGRALLLVMVISSGVMILPGAAPTPISHLMALLAGICPQRLTHSYTIAGVPLPLEARMLGMFGGFAITVGVFATAARARRFRYPAPGALRLVLLGFAAMAFDGTNAFFFDLGWPHAYAPDLRVRLLTGLLAGIAMAVLLTPAVATTVAAAVPPSARPTWRDLGVSALGSSLFGLLVVSGWPILLIPVAFVAASGALLAFTLINRTFLGAFCPVSQGEQHPWWWPELAASALALGELALLAWLRHVTSL